MRELFPDATDSQMLLYCGIYEMAKLLPHDKRFSVDMATFTKISRHAGAYMNLCDPSIKNVQSDTLILEHVPPPGARTDLTSYIGGDVQKVGGIAKYCRAIAKGIANTSRFAVTAVHELAMTCKNFYDSEYNPFTRAGRTNGEFGTYLVDGVDAEAVRIRQANMSKYDEYVSNYQMASYMYDTTLQLTKILHCSLLPEQLVKPLALAVQCVATQVQLLDYRLVLLKYCTHPDAIKRELAKQTVENMHEVMTPYPEFQKIDTVAAEIRLKRVKSELTRGKNVVTNAPPHHKTQKRRRWYGQPHHPSKRHNSGQPSSNPPWQKGRSQG